MDLTKEAIQTLQQSGEVKLFHFDGIDYSTKQLHPVPLAGVETLHVSTLNAIVDLIGGGFETVTSKTPSSIIHVVSPTEVAVLESVSNAAGDRKVFVRAKVGIAAKFVFGDWMSQEAFIIGLQSQFVPTDQRDQVLKVASKIASEDKLTVEDTGVHQTVTAKTGVALVEQVSISPRIELMPYRTFREVSQPPSEFIFRIKKGSDGMPKLALFEADGGAWQMFAMNNVANYLKELLPTVTVVL